MPWIRGIRSNARSVRWNLAGRPGLECPHAASSLALPALADGSLQPAACASPPVARQRRYPRGHPGPRVSPRRCGHARRARVSAGQRRAQRSRERAHHSRAGGDEQRQVRSPEPRSAAGHGHAEQAGVGQAHRPRLRDPVRQPVADLDAVGLRRPGLRVGRLQLAPVLRLQRDHRRAVMGARPQR